ncbi:MAG TPA: hypothetical protein DD402_18060, partial [Sulfitobacter sp.]|nr:hypothetical protein [Sulfitobacter sp.]
MADKSKRSWFGRTVLAAVMPVAAQAQTVQDGMAAFEQGDYTHALELLLPLAEQGDAEAQCQVGRLYYRGGDGVPQSFDDSVAWAKKSAEQNNPCGLNSLGVSYRFGQGVDPDAKTAFDYFTRAAAQGFDKAQFSLGNMHELGEGTAQSDAEARAWYHKAAEQGNAMGQYRLGILLLEGRGGEAAPEEA